jgi:hypothetical protein
MPGKEMVVGWKTIVGGLILSTLLIASVLRAEAPGRRSVPASRSPAEHRAMILAAALRANPASAGGPAVVSPTVNPTARLAAYPAVRPDIRGPGRLPDGSEKLLPEAARVRAMLIPTTWDDPFMLIPTEWEVRVVPTTTRPATSPAAERVDK